MKSSIELKNKFNLLSEIGAETKYQILQYDYLKGSDNVNSIMTIQKLQRSGRRANQVRIVLNESSIKVQDGALNYIKGYISNKEDLKNTNTIKKMLFTKNKNKNKEKVIKKQFSGVGEVLLKPSFEDFTFIELIDEEIIIDDEIFYACDSEINIYVNSNDDEKKEIILSGSGVVVLKLPVQEKEIIRCKLFKDRLIVNGDISILRSKQIKSYIDHEDNTKIYEGIGEVWLLPTRIIYDEYVKMSSIDLNKEDTEEKI